jgi:hypothetical protein
MIRVVPIRMESIMGFRQGGKKNDPTNYNAQEHCKRLLADNKRLQKRNEWLEEVVALAQEHGAIDLSDYGWPVWEGEE